MRHLAFGLSTCLSSCTLPARQEPHPELGVDAFLVGAHLEKGIPEIRRPLGEQPRALTGDSSLRVGGALTERTIPATSTQTFCCPATSNPAIPMRLRCCPNDCPCGSSTLLRAPKSSGPGLRGGGFLRPRALRTSVAGGGAPPMARKRTSFLIAAWAPSPRRNQDAPPISARSPAGRERMARSSAARTVCGLASWAAATKADRSNDPTCSPSTASMSELASR